MKYSLRQQLNDIIRQRGYISYFELKGIVEGKKIKGRYFKMSTAERRLRPSESPDIEEEKNEAGEIVGYKHKNPIQYHFVKVLDEKGEVEKIIKMPNA